nr:MAG TPA: CTD phosphatase subunit 1-like protein [Caudoviricetes sp.]
MIVCDIDGNMHIPKRKTKKNGGKHHEEEHH